ncbi:hypothetical protein FisN_12Hh224 [Fistulifera solaris]|uniref:Uncharacterized protein n=1 Tax=Fistulifera solaris TaxID=1519565 RepID=A0A1Z5KC25_FISSO|nr:hypothetical protein FisN_12Hh224 [Fistulifera solaris]|eukprot:GAX23651.1 hypothetical protein FisN_12Hh224 [Fistulifera solaris]
METKLSSASTSLSGSNGYSADSERTRLAQPSSLPVSISLHENEAKKFLAHFPSGITNLKRDPDFELNLSRQYLAKRAKTDLLSSGKDVPTSRLHDLLPAGAHLTTDVVNHIQSSSIPDASCIHNVSPDPSVYDDASTLASLVDICRHVYAGRPSLNSMTAEGSGGETNREENREDSASSVTDTESSTSDDGAKEVPRPSLFSQGGVFEASSVARLVLSSDYPFTIAHANVVFENLVNFTLTRVLGHAVGHFLAGDPLATALQECTTNQSHATVENQRLRIKPIGKGPKSYVCTIHVSPQSLPPPFSTYLSILIVPDEKQPQESFSETAASEEPFDPEVDDFETMSMEEPSKIMG